ncbi:hypothetical protein BX616_006775 [Lobosporangium transversale]|uniref:Uncharacterized protein n=1 Tax=Lobosporangium transversale TaxID=64571 RepID=A0A1Y2GE10_9FUNG|nr:hypothetical protein BCR41DRAFT_399289 [Lobosporangium transversale]KAF9896779.1 hypothetical protein BX616_006775 [Lobosporangium transversale]ORZ08241.1 hypothetical protein BCR41DRAFT_399289 [Lobosporangium transversale]|eukprot:XP_021878324.1 hypothetical protein BCR41DRAFT_399289 [Lobosporangium transversale]
MHVGTLERNTDAIKLHAAAMEERTDAIEKRTNVIEMRAAAIERNNELIAMYLEHRTEIDTIKQECTTLRHDVDALYSHIDVAQNDREVHRKKLDTMDQELFIYKNNVEHLYRSLSMVPPTMYEQTSASSLL